MNIHKDLFESDQENLKFKEVYADINLRTGWILYRMENREEAAKYSKKASDIYGDLYEKDPDNKDYEDGIEDAEDLWDILK